jgi:hypothetical protein
MGKQVVQEGAEHAPLWGPCVEDQHSEGVFAYLHHLGATRQEVQDPVAQDGVQTQDPKLSDELGGGYYGVDGRVVVNEQI